MTKIEIINHLSEYEDDCELALSMDAEGNELKPIEDIDIDEIDGKLVVVLFP